MDTNNTSIDTISVDKKKKSFLPKLLIALSSLFSIVGVGLAILPNHYKSARAVSYDDENYSITLSADEFYSFYFYNLGVYINDNHEVIPFGDTHFLYDDVDIGFDDFLVNDYLVYRGYDDLDNGYLISFNLNTSTTGSFRFTSSNFVFTSNLIWYIDADTYVDIKQAIEQDIQANQPYTNNTFLQDIIELLVGGIGVTASGIGTGLSVLVSNIAIQNGTMSPFMSLILIFGGIALALALSRWVVNLIGSLGQRNR